MTDIVTLWHAEHAKFTRLFDHLAERVERLAGGDDEQIDVITDIVAYLHTYGERAHHKREDIGFAHLARLDSAFADVIDELRSEHEQINEAGSKLLEQLDSLGKNAMVSRDAILQNQQHYLVLQRAHLAREEGDIIPAIAERFTVDDWKQVADEISRTVDTQMPADLLDRFRRLSKDISVELTLS